jgi:hypothetical protein
MGDQFLHTVSAVLLAITFVALVATIVSRNANTQGVITSSGQAFSAGLATAVSPVTGTGAGASIYGGAMSLGGGATMGYLNG